MFTPVTVAYLSGFAATMTLIVAIGAQNAFVLRQGIRREHVLPVVALCTVSDLVLIMVGIAGFGALVAAHPDAVTLIRIGGAAFLIGYGLLAARRRGRCRRRRRPTCRHGSAGSRSSAVPAGGPSVRR